MHTKESKIILNSYALREEVKELCREVDNKYKKIDSVDDFLERNKRFITKRRTVGLLNYLRKIQFIHCAKHNRNF